MWFALKRHYKDDFWIKCRLSNDKIKGFPLKEGIQRRYQIKYRLYNDKIKWFPLTTEFKDDFYE